MENDVSHDDESSAVLVYALFMFINVQSWILDGSWCCLWTDADRKTRSRRGPSKISLTWPLFHRCGTKAGSFGWGPTDVAAWVASVREGPERRTRDCLNMESKRNGASEIRSQSFAYRPRSQSKPSSFDFRWRIVLKLQKMYIYAKNKTRCLKKERKKRLSSS